jgi:U3 small nucleolar RNA-associated protein 6
VRACARCRARAARGAQYEEQLETLRRHRKRVLNAAAEEEDEAAAAADGSRKRARAAAPAGTSGAGDHAILRRIHFLYERALRKFRGDLRLWVRPATRPMRTCSLPVFRLSLFSSLTLPPPHTRARRQSRLFAFCRLHGGSRAMSRALARALALHPTEPALWSYAASWEFRQRKDAPAARALMQRALRACPASAGLWADYFGLEVAYAATLRERRAVLGLALPPVGDAAEAEADADAAGAAAGGEAAAAAPALAPGLAALLRGAVASAVFRAAAAALPGDVALAEQCLEALKPHAAWAGHLAEEVAASLAAPAAAAQPAAWAARAACAPTPAAAAALFESGLISAPGPAMWGLYGNALAAAGDVDALDALARRALAARQAPELLLLLWVDTLLSAGRDADASRAAEAATAGLPASARLWALRLRLVVEAAGAADDRCGARTRERAQHRCDAMHFPLLRLFLRHALTSVCACARIGPRQQRRRDVAGAARAAQRACCGRGAAVAPRAAGERRHWRPCR